METKARSESPYGNSLRARINAMCKVCIYDELDRGNWRQQVSACKAKDCPIWEVRPQSSKALEEVDVVPENQVHTA